jgi:hypothetical protein
VCYRNLLIGGAGAVVSMLQTGLRFVGPLRTHSNFKAEFIDSASTTVTMRYERLVELVVGGD